ncbi:MAG: electron transfer flavoprotein subunit beta/FixA family protein [Dehalococcoidales bacterium]|jgi:electron transfer flavoprotein beta subunit
MKIIVCLKEVVDPALSLDYISGHMPPWFDRLTMSGIPRRLNPNDAAALALALGLKAANTEAEITVVSIGPTRVESYLRNALALGADRAIRIWDEGLVGTPYQKASLLAAFASLSSADLVLTGVKSLDTASGRVGPLLAARLGLPCVVNVFSIAAESGNSISVVKDLGRGEREKLRCTLPAVLAVKGEGKLPYASLDKLIDSKSAEIKTLTPADLGISPIELQSGPLKIIGLAFPRPLPAKTPPLDSSLPAFYRILQLLEGGIAKRKGTILEGGPDELAEKLYRLFLKEGVLKKAPAVSS